MINEIGTEDEILAEKLKREATMRMRSQHTNSLHDRSTRVNSGERKYQRDAQTRQQDVEIALNRFSKFLWNEQ